MKTYIVEVLFTFSDEAGFYQVATITEEQVRSFENDCKLEAPSIVFKTQEGMVFLNRSEVRCVRLIAASEYGKEPKL